MYISLVGKLPWQKLTAMSELKKFLCNKRMPGIWTNRTWCAGTRRLDIATGSTVF